ncbi:MAG: hypothetical protein IPJ88_10400 [Myxococcales bacterium]|nr:MAG: hypothetical protein IPJ88_10400 [Myxococcales bacterium]
MTLIPEDGNFTTESRPETKRSETHSSVQAADAERFNQEALTYLIRGELNSESGVSCPPPALAEVADAAEQGSNAKGVPCFSNARIHFEFAVAAATLFGPCEIDGIPGINLPPGSNQTVAITIHGDHLFFNGFPEGSEGGIVRLAQWLADCDLNVDGRVSQAELQSIAPSDLSEIDERFQLGGSPISPLGNMWDYLTSQLKTQGHYQGEGECPYN